MTETIPTRPFDDGEAIAWLRSQPDGRVTANAAELARQWGWNRMRAGCRLKAWQKAGHIRRNAEEIIVTTPVTPTVTEIPGATVTRHSKTFVKLAAFIVALALACVSAAFSIDGVADAQFCLGRRQRHGWLRHALCAGRRKEKARRRNGGFGLTGEGFSARDQPKILRTHNAISPASATANNVIIVVPRMLIAPLRVSI